jgi:hypothetical protein
MVRGLQLPALPIIAIMLAVPFFLHILLFLDQMALFFILVPIYVHVRTLQSGMAVRLDHLLQHCD